MYLSYKIPIRAILGLDFNPNYHDCIREPISKFNWSDCEIYGDVKFQSGSYWCKYNVLNETILNRSKERKSSIGFSCNFHGGYRKKEVDQNNPTKQTIHPPGQ